MSEIDYSLLNDFITEASEHLEEMESRLLALVPDGDNTRLWNDIFRPIHTIKGASQFVGLDRVSAISHRLEDLLDLLRQGAFPASQAVIDILIEGRDRIARLVKDLETSETEQTPVEDLVTRVTWLIDHKGDASGGTAAPEPAAEETVAVDAAPVEMEPEQFEPEQVEPEPAELAPPQAHVEPRAAAQETPDPSFEDEGVVAMPVMEFEEEYDQELFQIYIEQLRDKAGLLGMLVRALDGSSEGADIVGECRHHVAKLRSAANYMGYDLLVEMYDQWQESMETAVQLLSQGHAIDLSFMAIFFNRLLASVPDLADIPPAEWQGVLVEQEPVQPAAVQAAAAPKAEPAPVKAKPQPAPVQDEFQGMDGREEPEFEQEDVEDFINESAEHLDEMENGLLRFDSEPDNREILDDIFRAAHTIKGVAQFIGLARISAICHRLEDLLSQLRQGTLEATPLAITVLLAAKDRLGRLVEDLVSHRRESTPVDDLLRRMDLVIQGGEQAPGRPHGEEYDRELYAIFVDQLADYLARIRGVHQEYAAAADGVTWVQKLSELVRHLRHAASYMDYTELRDLYDDWLGDLGQAEFALMSGEHPALDFVPGYIDRIEVQFPEVGGEGYSAAEMEASAPVVAAPVSPAAVEETAAPLLAPVAPVEPEPFQAVAPTPKTQPKPKPAAAPSTPADEEEELFIRLTEALEGGLGQDSDREYETLHGVFEQMLGVEKAAPAKAATPAAAEPAKPKAAPAPAAAAPTPQPQPQMQVSAQPGAAAAAPAKSEPAKPEAPKGESAEAKGAGPAAGGAGKPPAEPTAGAEGEDEKKKGDRGFKKSVRVDADKIDALMNQVGELIVDRSYFYQLFNEMNLLQRHLRDELGIDQRDLKQVRTFTYRLGEAISSLSRTSNELQEGVMKVRMLPISQIFNRYPRLIHDLTRNTNKKVNLVIRGEETELDKMIVEELSDPMIHIIRNAVDHGFETVDERKRMGKPEAGTLIVEAYQESNHIVIEVNDDGRGIDPERIKAKALERKMSTKDELDRLSPRELMRLIMQPGFSTANQITRTSGRGVGMDVAKQNVEKLNGTIEVDSQPGRSTQIRLKIPLTLAIIPALLVRVGTDSFTIPLSNVEETLRINDADTSTIEGTEVIHLRGRTMPIFRLDRLFGIKGDAHEEQKSFVVIVNAGAEQIGMVVDELMGQEEVVIKPLVDYLQEKSGFSGATIIGDGRISLILDIYELVHMTAMGQADRIRSREYRRKVALEQPKSAAVEAARPTVH